MGKIVVEDSFSSNTAKASGILPIGKEAVHKICSGQVVLTLAVAMKELLENSLDAGATAIDIRLVDQGSTLLEVADNGSGIKEDDFEEIALKHHTSKLSSFTDLEFVGTFGFRGEALSSLCSLCGGLTVLTYHNSSVCATSLEFDVNGVLVKRKPCARQVGTTVTLHSLFSGLPVRRKEFLRHLQREFVKMTHLLYAYCLVSTGVRITCMNRNQSKGSSSTTVVATQGRGTIRDNIGCVFGQKQLASLIDFKQKDIPDDILEEFGLKKMKEYEKPSQDPEAGVDEINVSSSPYNITGCISTCEHGKGRGAPDRQFFFVNSRPCEPTKVIKLVNEVYHQYNSHQYPFVFLDIITNGCGIDVNVTPDKRKIFIENEKFLLAIIKASLLDLYKSVPSTYKLQNLPASYGTINNSLIQERHRGDKDENSIPSSSISSSPKSSLSSPQSSKPMSVSQALARFSQSPNNMRPSDSPNVFKRQSNSFDGPKSKQPKLDMFVASKPSSSKMSPVNEDNSSELAKDAGQEEYRNSLGKSVVEIVECGEVHHSTSEGGEVTVGDSGTEKIEGFTSDLESVDRSLCVEEINTASELKSPENTSVKVNGSIDLRGEGDITSRRVCVERKESRNLRETLFKVDEIINHHRGDCNIEIYERTNCVSTKFNDESSSTCVRDKVIESDTEVVVLDDSNSVGGERELKTVQFNISLAGITRRLKKAEERNMKRVQMEEESRIAARFSAGINPKDNVSAESELQREITKDMFSKMEIIGQFNLGFVIAKLGSDLFIIDQHASDEKYNFETLQQTTSLQQQPLVVPQPLDLTAASKAILMENIEVFERNGFKFSFPSEDEKKDDRVRLTSIPYSRNWTFGREDVDELIFMLQDSPHANCRPSRVRDMFASRACRKSIMIGTALNTAEMRSLIDHMGQMDQPWNCPHGRPTMRHLVNLKMLTTG